MKTVDNIVIELQHIEEKSLLAVLAALQAYEKNAFDKHAAFYKTKVGNTNLELNLHIVRSKSFSVYDIFWIKCLNHLRAIHTSKESALTSIVEDTKELTSYFIIDEIQARSIAEKSSKGLFQAFGIMIGSEPTSLPDVSALAPVKLDNTKKMLLAFPAIMNDILSGTNVYPELLNDRASIEERIYTAFECGCYAGGMTLESYIMCTLKKPVLEISSISERYMLSKWSSQNYFHTELDKDSILKGIKLCLNRYLQGK